MHGATYNEGFGTADLEHNNDVEPNPNVLGAS
jgi:hypothetical protein